MPLPLKCLGCKGQALLMDVGDPLFVDNPIQLPGFDCFAGIAKLEHGPYLLTFKQPTLVVAFGVDRRLRTARQLVFARPPKEGAAPDAHLDVLMNTDARLTLGLMRSDRDVYETPFGVVGRVPRYAGEVVVQRSATQCWILENDERSMYYKIWHRTSDQRERIQGLRKPAPRHIPLVGAPKSTR